MKRVVVIRKVFQILNGWGKAWGILNVSTGEQKLSELRLKICGDCALSKQSTFLKIIQGNVNNSNELVCTKCHCPCLEKTLVVDEKCPVDKW